MIMKIRPDRRVANLLDEPADRGIQWRVFCRVQFLIRVLGDAERVRLGYSRVQIKNICVVGARRINIIIESSGTRSKNICEQVRLKVPAESFPTQLGTRWLSESGVTASSPHAPRHIYITMPLQTSRSEM